MMRALLYIRDLTLLLAFVVAICAGSIAVWAYYLEGV